MEEVRVVEGKLGEGGVAGGVAGAGGVNEWD